MSSPFGEDRVVPTVVPAMKPFGKSDGTRPGEGAVPGMIPPGPRADTVTPSRAANPDTGAYAPVLGGVSGPKPAHGVIAGPTHPPLKPGPVRKPGDPDVRGTMPDRHVDSQAQHDVATSGPVPVPVPEVAKRDKFFENMVISS